MTAGTRIFVSVVLLVGASSLPATGGEVLYNGIRLPDPWPPRPREFARGTPVEPPYLVRPPKVIPIDVGRQLFVDDFLIESTDLQRQFHLPEWHPASPVLRAEMPWEVRKGAPFAAPFSDGVWHDPKDRLFKMWYMGGTSAFFCYATSSDGIRWERPALKQSRHGDNVLDIEPTTRDSGTVWLDLEETDPARRFKLFYWRAGIHTRFSADGIRWSDVAWSNRASGDRTTFFHNPFRKRWIYSIRREQRGVGRCRYYGEFTDPGVENWTKIDELSRWACADAADRVRPGPYEGELPDLYNLDAAPYESLMLGQFTIQSKVAEGDRPKVNHVTLGYSRDGFHWSRPDRRAFLNVSEDKTAWNYGNVQSAGGGCLVMGDKLYFYCSGRNSRKAMDDGTGASTGLAVLRRDGFASMEAGDREGRLTTRPVQFHGGHLFVNVDAPQGELRVEVLDGDGRVIEPYTRDNCDAVRTDRTLQPVKWKGAADLAELAGKPVRFRFHLNQGNLYSFWVSPDRSGASNGYVAAGGPGFKTNRDTVGLEALRSGR